MALPKPNNQTNNVTVGLDQQTLSSLKKVSDSVQNAGRNFVTNVKQSNIKERAKGTAVKAARATGEGATRLGSGTALAATQNPFIAQAVEKGISGALKLPESFKKGLNSITGLFKNNNKEAESQQKTNENLKQINKNQTAQKGVFTDILNVLKDIRENIDSMLGIDRQQLQNQKEAAREKEAQELINLEKRREKARQQPRDASGRFVKGGALTENQLEKLEDKDDYGLFDAFLTGGVGGFVSRIFKSLAKVFTVGFWTRVLPRIIGKVGGPIAIGVAILSGIKGAVEGFMESEKDTLAGKVADGIRGLVGEITEWLTFGAISREQVQKMMENLNKTINDFISDVIDKIKNAFTDKNRKENPYDKRIDSTVTSKETDQEYIVKDIQSSSKGPDIIKLKNKDTGETKVVPEQEFQNNYKRESSVKDGSTSTQTNQSNVDKAISDASKEFGVPESVLRKMAFFESKMNPTARNPDTTARGLFQITENTEGLIEKNLGVSGNPMNARDASRMAAALAKDEINAFTEKYGFSPTAQQIQAMHLLGRKTAFKAFDNPNTNIGRIDSDAVEHNEWLKGKNIDEALIEIGKRFRGVPLKSNTSSPTVQTGGESDPIKPNDNFIKNDTLRKNMSGRIEDSVKNQSVGKQAQNNIVAPTVNTDNRQFSETNNLAPAAKSGSSDSTFSKINNIMRMA